MTRLGSTQTMSQPVQPTFSPTSNTWPLWWKRNSKTPILKWGMKQMMKAIDIESMFPEDISEPSDSEHHPNYEHDRPSTHTLSNPQPPYDMSQRPRLPRFTSSLSWGKTDRRTRFPTRLCRHHPTSKAHDTTTMMFSQLNPRKNNSEPHETKCCGT